jgi:hypothetical protein
MDNKKKIIILVVILIVILTSSYFYFKDYGHRVILSNHEYLYGDKQLLRSGDNFPPSFEGVNYTFSVWIRTDNIPLNAHWDNDTQLPKPILTHDGTPNIYFLLPNKLRIEIGYKDQDGVLDYYNFEFELYESQVWNNFIIVVNNRNVDIYKNKVLVKSKLIDNIPWFTQKIMKIGERNNNFNGYVGFIDYFNYNIKREQVVELYEKNIKKIPVLLKNYKQNLEDDSNNSNLLNLINK